MPRTLPRTLPRTFTQDDLAVNEASYQRCVRGFGFLEKKLGLNIRLHAKPGAIEDGQIILFNHFARFETIVPQYLIYQQTGAYCRTLASGEFFSGGGKLSKFLLGIGGVLNNLDGLLPFMAAEILRGRKVVVFPEGGMSKDRRVIDEAGEYRIFSPTARAWRKHHKGAAAIAVMLDIFKQRILSVRSSGDEARLTRWAQALEIDSVEALLAAAEKPTLIVPGNITFSPLRVDENILKRSAELFFKRLRDQAREELLIEGNILLKDTDMDIRLGAPVSPHTSWHWAERKFLDWSFERINDLEHLFDLNASPDKWIDRLANNLVVRNTRRLRDQCTAQIYRQVTVNLSHLAAHLMFRLVARGVTEIDRGAFRRALYLAIKYAQQDPAIFLHPALTDPLRYDGLHTGKCAELDQFIALAVKTGLVTDEGGKSRFLERISEDQDFHNVRLRNPVQVYANEIAAVPAACAAVARGLEQSQQLDPAEFARLLLDEGFPVIGVRLAGHGTSPWDLRDRSWQDWMDSVRSGYRLLAPLVEEICLVGFSLGGVLSLRLAAENPSGLAGVASIAAPIRLRNRNLGFIPMVHGANKLAERTNFGEGPMPFLLNESEHPEINYRHLPVRAVYELRKAMGDLQRHLPGVTCPVSVIQGDSDHIVDPASARIIHECVASARKQLHWIETDRHGILSDDIGGCHGRILDFVSSLEAASLDEKQGARQPRVRAAQEEAGYVPSLGFQG
jgi:esterase/lipase